MFWINDIYRMVTNKMTFILSDEQFQKEIDFAKKETKLNLCKKCKSCYCKEDYCNECLWRIENEI